MDIDKLVDAVTRVIMERLNDTGGACKVVAFGDVPAGLVGAGYDVKRGSTCADIGDCDYIVMTAESYRAFHGIAPASSPAPAAAACAACAGKVIDLTGKRLVHERDLRDANTQSGDTVLVGPKAIVTALAFDYAKGLSAKITKG